jgi:hypothetical protein
MRSVIRDVFGAGAVSDPAAEFRLFTRIRLPSGVLKTTEPRRLDDVNDLALRVLPSERPLELMDVAMSTAITTLEWSEQLTAAGIEHHLVAGDSHIDAVWLALPFADLLLDRDRKELLLADVLGRPVDVAGASTRSALALPVLKAAARLSNAVHLPVRRIELVSPRVHESAAIEVVEDDIFVSRPEMIGRFHAVRAANILNLGYFDEGRLRAAAASLRQRLRPGGLLIVCRTHDGGRNNGTFFRAAGDGWEVVDRIGDGSEIEHLLV